MKMVLLESFIAYQASKSKKVRRGFMRVFAAPFDAGLPKEKRRQLGRGVRRR